MSEVTYIQPVRGGLYVPLCVIVLRILPVHFLFPSLAWKHHANEKKEIAKK